MTATYATVDDVKARLPGRTLSSSTKPSTSDVQTWLDDGQAQVDSALGAAGLSVPMTDARAVAVAKTWIVNYAEGRWRASLAAIGGDATNRDGQDLIDAFYRMVGPTGTIAQQPEVFSNYLTGTVAASNARLRSHVTSNRDELAAGTFDPIFRMDEKF